MIKEMNENKKVTIITERINWVLEVTKYNNLWVELDDENLEWHTWGLTK